MNKFIFREATLADIEQIQIVRNAVNENKLSNPNVITNEDCVNYLTQKGKGWVCEINNSIVGFSIIDLTDHNVWALFVHPDYENQSIGKHLHNLMLEWYFEQTQENAWLSTALKTRAVFFYKKQGWIQKEVLKNGEIKFEMSFDNWKARQNEINNETIKPLNN